MALPQVGLNDAVLLVSLVYLCVDITCEWEAYEMCQRPIHKWLLGSYVLILSSRFIYAMGSAASASRDGEFLLNMREKSAILRALMSVTWLVILPLFMLWSALGTAWILEVRTSTPSCMQDGVHMWFLFIWQALSYLWIIIHCGLGAVAWFLEWRVRRVEGDLRLLEDADVLSRWGQVSRLHGYAALPCAGLDSGLSPAEIAALPGASTIASDVAEDCPICLHTLQRGDVVRKLCGCSHTFHRPCIDLWLLRRADCPLCKRQVGKAAERRPLSI